MKKIKEYKELSTLVLARLKKNVATNMFLNKEEIEEELENMYYIENEVGLFIFRDKETHYLLNYYTNTENLNTCDIFESLEKPVVVEVVSKYSEDEKYKKVIEFFEKNNMKIQIERIRLTNKNTEKIQKSEEPFQIHFCNEFSCAMKTVEITACTADDADEVYEILKNNFNKYYGCLITKERMKNEIKQIYKAVIDNKIVGILHKKETKNNLEIRHLAVNEQYRGNGIANKLVEHALINSKATNQIVWTGKENEIAKQTYKKYGYVEDGYVSTVLMK